MPHVRSQSALGLHGKRIVLQLLALAFLAAVPGPHVVAQGKAIVVSSEPGEVVVDYFPSALSPTEVLIGGRPSAYFPESELSRQPGAVGLPQESFLVGIPPTGSITISVVSDRVQGLSAASLAPVASYELVPAPLPHLARVHSEIIEAFPGEPVETAVLSGIYRLRNQRIAVIKVNPVRFDGSGALVRSVSLRISIKMEEPAHSVQPPPDPLFESVYSSVLVNYEQSKSWRAAAPLSSGPTWAQDSTASWFTPGAEYFRIAVATEGIIRIPFEDVQSIAPVGADPGSFDLLYKGRPIPFRIIGEEDGVFGFGDTIEFLGMKLTGNNGGGDEYSDTSVYWLSFSGIGGMRTLTDTVISGTPDLSLTRSFQSIRLEKDSIYFFGDSGLPSNNQTETVSGEGWYWRRLFAGQSTFVTWNSSNLYQTGSPNFVVRGRLHSPVANSATPNHNIEVSLNGTVVGSVLFPGISDTTFSFMVPSTLFLEGMNSVRLRSIATAATVNEVYIDWIQVDFLKNMIADDDSLLIVPDEGSEGQTALLQVSGFSQPDISAYRMDPSSGLEKRFRGLISGSPGDYAIMFTDTLQSGRSYLVLTDSKKMPPARVSKKTMGNLRSMALGADYVVITGKSLTEEADRLAQYRGQRNGWRTEVVTVEDIYDEFNFGHFSPFAIRNFIQAADSFWIAPKPAVVVLFGDANWDFKDNFKTGKPNIVPSYGNPVSDSWFVETPGIPYLPQKQVGRIPVATPAAAEAFVDMLMEYEAGSLSMWNKTFMFMASGFDATETTRFLQFSDLLIDDHITSHPIAGRASRLYKTVTNVVEFEQTEEVKQMLAAGAVWINFYGHAGTEFWGNGISSASQLENGEGKRHLVSDISCSTVRFAEPLVDSFGERLLTAAAGGAVGYLGSSGFGFEIPLRSLADRVFGSLSADTVRTPGALLLNAKIAFWPAGSMVSQQALRQFSFLGDPATELAIASEPDVAVDPADFRVEPNVPSEADNAVTIVVPVSNYGLSTADSLLVRWVHTFENEPPEIIDLRVPAPLRQDTVQLSVSSFKRGGSHDLLVVLDPLNAIAEETDANNEGRISFFVTSGLLQVVAPFSSSAVHPDSVRFTVLNPNLRLKPSHRLALDIDTSGLFNSPAKVNVSDVPLGVLTTSWQAPSGLFTDSTVYHWRARVYDEVDSTEWVSSIFLASTNLRPRWIQRGAGMFLRNILTEVRAGDALELQERDLAVEALSTGFNYGNDVALYVDGVNISMGFTNRGYNIAVLNQYSGALESFAAFDILESPDTTALAQHLEAIPPGRIVIAAVSDEAAVNKTERINKAFESIGSALIRSVTFRASWAIIGAKGAPIGSVPEDLESSGISITLQDTIHVASIAGSALTEEIGPARRWRDVSWEVDTANVFTHASLGLVRTFDTGLVDTLHNVQPGVDSISVILPDDIRSVRLFANLRTDSAGFTPSLRGWSVDFDPPAELALSYQTITLDRDSVLEGENIVVSGFISNIGSAPAESVEVAFSVLEGTGFLEFTRDVIPSIPAGASVAFAPGVVSTAGRPMRSAILVFVDPQGLQRERFISNNAVSLPVVILRDTVSPMFDVRFDGQFVFDNDYVRPEPEIQVLIRDNSPLAITDPNSVVLKLNNRRIALGTAPDSLFETLAGDEKARVTFRPTLARGNHVLSVQVLDASGNAADSMEFEVRFKVETDLRVLQVFNVPNPFSTETAFTFHLTGLGMPDEVTLRVYTIAGRLVFERKLLPGGVNIGFNRVPWDGRDQNGDPVANGVYFYKVSAKAGGKLVEVIEKLARLR